MSRAVATGLYKDRGFTLVVICLAVVSSVIFFLRYMHMVETGKGIIFEDFQNLAVAARSLAHRDLKNIYPIEDAKRLLAGTSTASYHPVVSPPVMLLLIAPLGLVSYPVAVAMWFIIPFLALIAIFATLSRMRIFPELEAYSQLQYFLLIDALALPTGLITVLSGQSGLLTAALLIGGVVNINARPKIAGLCFGMLVIKPHLALLVPVALLAGKHMRVLAYAGLSALGFLLLSLLVWGWDLWVDFFSMAALQAQTLEVGAERYYEIMISIYNAARLFNTGHQAALIVQSFSALAAAVMVWQCFKTCKNEGIRACMLIAAGFLVPPYLCVYDMPVLMLPLIWLAGRGLGPHGLTGGERKAFILILFAPLASTSLNMMHIPIATIAIIALALVFYCRTINA